VGGLVGVPGGFVDGADGGFVVGSGFLEAGEVVGAEKEFGGLVHGLEVEVGVGVEVGPAICERVLGAVQEVGVLPAGSTETRMKLVRNFPHFVYHNRLG